MKQKSIRNIRKEFKDHGVFYTPPELAKKLKSYVDIEPKDVYDPTCGAGNLLSVFGADVMKYGQELDPEQLALIELPNFIGYAGDTLTDDGFKGMTFSCIVANPPFSVRWDPEKAANDERFSVCGTLPPPSKADWPAIDEPELIQEIARELIRIDRETVKEMNKANRKKAEASPAKEPSVISDLALEILGEIAREIKEERSGEM